MPARKPTNPLTEPKDGGLFVAVGQLLEATKAATDGIKSLSIEVRQNATAIITAAKTLEMVEDTVNQLNMLVRNNPTSLVRQVDNHIMLLEDLRKANDELDNAIADLVKRVDELGTQSAKLGTTSNVVGTITFYAIVVLAWVTTTGIALYAALKGNG